MPTETVYGLAANALNPAAVRRIFRLKGRPAFNPLIVHVASLGQARAIARLDNPAALRLASRFWPGPLTLVLPRLPAVPPEVTAGLDTVAVRMPAHPVARRLLEACALPLAAPSANRSGHISPTDAAAVRAEFGARTPLLLDGGPCRHGIESTVVRPRRGFVEILRQGAVPASAIARAARCPVRLRVRTVLRHPDAPGMLARHYAPRKPLRLLNPGWRRGVRSLPPGAALLLFRNPPRGFSGPVELLAPDGSPETAARRLYAALRRLDRSPATVLFAELVPERGLGASINDRLRRAARQPVGVP